MSTSDLALDRSSDVASRKSDDERASSSPKATSRVNRGGYIVELDGLRGLAILSVMVFHFSSIVPLSAIKSSLSCRLFGMIAVQGWCGVDLFFVLSGFLITGILYDTRESSRYFTAFYGRRSLRIFPLYYAVLIVTFLVIPQLVFVSSKMQTLIDVQSWYWLYAANFLRVLKGPISGDWVSLEHFWSLAVEEHFYLIWPLVVLGFSRINVMRVCGLLVIVALLSRIVMIRLGSPFAAYMLTPCRMDSLALGGLLAMVFRSGVDPSKIRRAAWQVAAISSLIMIGIVIYDYYAFRHLSPVVQTVGYPALGLLCTSMVALAVTASEESRYSQILRSPLLRFFGKYSYGLYVAHFIIFSWLEKALPFSRVESVVGWPFLAMIVHMGISLTLSTGAAWLSWHLIEKHFVAAKKLFAYDKLVRA